MEPVELRALVPRVLSVLVRRGADFATAEDAVQEALIRALVGLGARRARRPDGLARHRRVACVPRHDPVRRITPRPGGPLRHRTASGRGPQRRRHVAALLPLRASRPHARRRRSRSTLRAVGGLTTRQIAQAYLVPEPTMAQRISRAKRTIAQSRIDRPGDVRTVMRVLYLVFNEGYTGDVDLAAEAIRLTRQLAAVADDAEVDGLLALMLLHHARRRSRTRPDGGIVPLAAAGPRPMGHGPHRRGRRDPPGRTGARRARRVPGPGGDRRAPRRRAARRGHRLGADRGVVRRAAALRRHAGGAAQPRRRGRRGRRRRAGLAALAEVDGDVPATRRGGRLPPREERRPRARRPTSTPTRLATRPTSRSATTRCSRPPACASCSRSSPTGDGRFRR